MQENMSYADLLLFIVTCLSTSKNPDGIVKQLAQMIYNTTDSHARRIIWQKPFEFGLKLICIWQCEPAYFQSCIHTKTHI